MIAEVMDKLSKLKKGDTEKCNFSPCSYQDVLCIKIVTIPSNLIDIQLKNLTYPKTLCDKTFVYVYFSYNSSKRKSWKIIHSSCK